MAMTLCPILPWLFPVIVTLVTAEIVPPVTINTFGSCASADGALEKRLAILEAMITKQQDMLATVINGGKEKEVIRGTQRLVNFFLSFELMVQIHSIRPPTLCSANSH